MSQLATGAKPERSSAAKPKRATLPSGMTARPNLWLRLLGWLFFRGVTVDPRWVERLKEESARGPVAYVLDRQSLLDFLFLNWAFHRLGVPLVPWAADIHLRHGWFFRPLVTNIMSLLRWVFAGRRSAPLDAEGLRQNLAEGKDALVFMRGAWGIMGLGGGYREDMLTVLADPAAAGIQGPLTVVPMMIVWQRPADRYRRFRSFLDMAFGSPNAPGRLRKLIMFLIGHRTAIVRFAEPPTVAEGVEPEAPKTEPEAAVLPSEAAAWEPARRLRWKIQRTLDLEHRVISGPVVKDSKLLRAEIERNPDFLESCAQVAAEEGVPVSQVQSRASKYLREMAANFRHAYVEYFCILLALIWNRIYEGIHVHEDGLDRIREAAKSTPLMLTPNHRSHVDYLVISYVFYINGLVPPHIAAGINLSFFPMGHLFRHCGAFFIRRSFKGNATYQMTFRHYLRKILKEGYWVEFFPEGGRSRTGKVLPPKTGMLREIMAAVADGAVEDLTFCPTSISYEKIVEEAAIARELRGGEKKSENAGSVLKASKVLSRKHGRLYMRFGELFSVRQYLEQQARLEGSIEAVLSDEVFPRIVKHFGYAILHRINQAAVVTPTGLVSMILLAHPRKGISRSQLMLRIGYLADYFARTKGADLADSLLQALEGHREQLDLPQGVAVLDRAPHGSLASGEDLYRARIISRALDTVADGTIDSFIERNALMVRNYGDEVTYTVEPTKRVNLDYYKNNILHLVVPEALLATALTSARRAAGGNSQSLSYQDIEARCRFLSTLFRREFVYDPDKGFEQQFFDTLGRFVAAGWISENEDGSLNIEDGADELLVFFARTMGNFIEAYWLVLDMLGRVGPEGRREKDFVKDVQKHAEKLFEDGDLRFLEASSTALFKGALTIFREVGLVSRTDGPPGATSTGQVRAIGDAPAPPEKKSKRKGKKKRKSRRDPWVVVDDRQALAVAAWTPKVADARLAPSPKSDSPATPKRALG